MKSQLSKILDLILLFFKLLITRDKKIFLMDPPEHPNLGDQAQLMCTYKWLTDSFPNYEVFNLPTLRSTLNFGNYKSMFASSVYAILCHLTLKLFIKKKDILVGHSGYFFVDHHDGWKMYQEMLEMFPENKMIILPQTINFYTPFILNYAKKMFSNKNNLILLCRDEKSYDNAQKWFAGTKTLLYPDIVTSLVGTYPSNEDKSGVIFIIRNDVEAYYSKEEIKKLEDRFIDVRKEEIDTTLVVENWETVANNRDKYIYEAISKISTYQVAITDRYHGTIFSAIASTPVVVISSGDHKLSSGVKWFEKAGMSENVMFAQSLDEAYTLASRILESRKTVVPNTYFKDEYWSLLKEQLNLLNN